MDAKAGEIDFISAWRHFLVKGHPDQLNCLEAEVERRFSKLGWSRDKTREGKMNSNSHLHQINHFICWVGGPSLGPRVLLCLNRATLRRMRGGTYSLVDDPSGTGWSGIANVVKHALADVLEPAVAAVGLTIAYPHFGPISRVGPRTAAAIMAFAEAAEGQWPLPQTSETAWRRFVVTACRDDVAFDASELEGWFAANGWDAQAAVDLTRRFFADAALLSEYDEAEERPAWR